MVRRVLTAVLNPNQYDTQVSKSLAMGLGYASLFAAVFFVSDAAIDRLGLVAFSLLLVGAFFGMLYSYVSWNSLIVPFCIVILSVGGFRFLFSMKMPGLPDLYMDRAAMLWLVVIFVVKSVAERKTLRPPYLLDTLLIVNALYLLVYLFIKDFDHFGLWTRSYLMPYAAYFLAKNILTTQRSMRFLLIMLAALNVYYGVTSIAEKFNIAALVWPKAILYTETVWWNRSNGPFAHAPLFGTVMGLILPVYLYFIATSRNRLIQVASYVALLIALAGLYFTYTRGSWLAGIVALLVAIALNRRQYLRISAPAMILVPLIAIFVLGAGNDAVMKERVDDDNTINARLGAATTVMRVWRDNPIFGVGFFQYWNVRENYIEPIDLPIVGTIRFANFRHTSIHDIYLGPLAETGLLGASLQFAIYLVIIRAFLRHLRNPNAPPHFRRYILPVLGGLCVGYLVGGLAIDYRFFSMVGTMFYTTGAIVYGYQGDKVVPAHDERDLDAEA